MEPEPDKKLRQILSLPFKLNYSTLFTTFRIRKAFYLKMNVHYCFDQTQEACSGSKIFWWGHCGGGKAWTADQSDWLQTCHCHVVQRRWKDRSRRSLQITLRRRDSCAQSKPSRNRRRGHIQVCSEESCRTRSVWGTNPGWRYCSVFTIWCFCLGPKEFFSPFATWFLYLQKRLILWNLLMQSSVVCDVRNFRNDQWNGVQHSSCSGCFTLKNTLWSLELSLL